MAETRLPPWFHEMRQEIRELEAERDQLREALELARAFFQLADAERGFWHVETWHAYGEARDAVLGPGSGGE